MDIENSVDGVLHNKKAVYVVGGLILVGVFLYIKSKSTTGTTSGTSGIGSFNSGTTQATGTTTTGSTSGTTNTSNDLLSQLGYQQGLAAITTANATTAETLREQGKTFDSNLAQSGANFTTEQNKSIANFNLDLSNRTNAATNANTVAAHNATLKNEQNDFNFLYGANQPTVTNTTSVLPLLHGTALRQKNQTTVPGQSVVTGQSRNDILFAASQAPLDAQFKRDQTDKYYTAQLADYASSQSFSQQSQLLLENSQAALDLQKEKDRSQEEITAKTTGVQRQASTNNLLGGVVSTIGKFFGL